MSTATRLPPATPIGGRYRGDTNQEGPPDRGGGWIGQCASEGWYYSQGSWHKHSVNPALCGDFVSGSDPVPLNSSSPAHTPIEILLPWICSSSVTSLPTGFSLYPIASGQLNGLSKGN